MHRVLFGTLGIGLLLLAAGVVRAQEPAKAVIEKAIMAHGGPDKPEQKLVQLNTIRTKSKGTVQLAETGVPFVSESVVRVPGQFKSTYDLEINGQKQAVTQVYDGESAWAASLGQTIELKKEVLAEMKEIAHSQLVTTLVPLMKEGDFSLTIIPEVKVNERDAIGVRVGAKGRRDIDLYFDKESGLLVKMERKSLDPANREITAETIFSDHKEVSGVKRPTKLLINYDGKKFLEAEITETLFDDKIDDKDFIRP